MSTAGTYLLLTGDKGWQLQINGSMNPSIHHPAWYRLAGLISEEEYKGAIASQPTAGPLVASFSLAGIDVQCRPDAWSVASANVENLAQPLSLATRVFDEKLPHTPIQRCTLTFFFHQKAQLDGSPRARFLRCMNDAGIGLTPPDGANTSFSYSHQNEGRHEAVVVEPSQRKADSIFLSYTAMYLLRPIHGANAKPPIEQFFIGPLLESHAAAAKETAENVLNRVLNTLECVKE